jgi:hypothetical protein
LKAREELRAIELAALKARVEANDSVGEHANQQGEMVNVNSADVEMKD